MSIVRTIRSLSILLLTVHCCGLNTAVFAQEEARPVTSEERSEVLDQLRGLLIDNYVFPQVAEEISNHLKARFDDGGFGSFTDPDSFATHLSDALQFVNQDKHLRTWVQSVNLDTESPEDRRARRLREERRSNFGFQQLEHHEQNVGYLDIRSFSGNKYAKEIAAGAMLFLSNSDAVIIDLRKNKGGSPALVQFVCSYFFSEKTHLNSLYFRPANRTTEFWTLDDLPGQRMPTVPLFILTSNATFSAAEEFTYNMQTQNRATIIGETTGGGAHPGRTFSLNDRLEVFISTGRAINPVTGTNWEGTGVVPDISVPADSVLSVALSMAAEAATNFERSQNEGDSN